MPTETIIINTKYVDVTPTKDKSDVISKILWASHKTRYLLNHLTRLSNALDFAEANGCECPTCGAFFADDDGYDDVYCSHDCHDDGEYDVAKEECTL